MAPVEMKKRERTATPQVVAPKQSVGTALAGLLGVVGNAVATGSRINNQNMRTETIKNNKKVRDDYAAAQAEEAELTTLLAQPGLTPR